MNQYATQPRPRSQTAQMLHLLQEVAPSWVALPVLVQNGCGYAVHSRANDLRGQGWDVKNRIERGRDGKKLSFYRLASCDMQDDAF